MLLFAMLISGSFSLGGMAAPHMDPAALNAIRFAIAAVIMGAMAAAGPGLRRRHAAAPWRYFVLGALLASYFVLMFEALRLTDPVSTGTVFTLSPLMTAGFGWLVLRQVTTPVVALALSVAAAGAVWVIFRGDVEALMAFRIGPGEAIFLLGSAAHSLYIPMLVRLRRGEPLVVSTFGVLVAAGILITAFGARALVGTDFAALPAIVWITILYTSTMTTALTFYLIQYASARLPGAKVMAYTYLVPSFVIIWEGALGHGWVAPAVLPGVAATVVALLVLLRA
ncbi:MAG: DMT family transporter [Alphaproteobacteria bacterium]|nr:MAG: DMT family transporter [Alphaproteobacteria bacterium]